MKVARRFSDSKFIQKIQDNYLNEEHISFLFKSSYLYSHIENIKIKPLPEKSKWPLYTFEVSFERTKIFNFKRVEKEIEVKEVVIKSVPNEKMVKALYENQFKKEQERLDGSDGYMWTMLIYDIN